MAGLNIYHQEKVDRGIVIPEVVDLGETTQDA